MSRERDFAMIDARVPREIAWRELRQRLDELEPDVYMNAEWRAMLWRRVDACLSQIKAAEIELARLRAQEEQDVS